jgi:short-subunit dehydrogenase
VPRSLTNRNIIITGASSGIGAATAVACANAGMDVVLNARRADKLESVAERVRGAGRAAVVVEGDVGHEDTTSRLLDAVERRFGHIDVVFANAGYGVDRPMHEISDADLREIFEVNFFAAVELISAAAQRLIAAQRPGHLLMCSSCVSKFTLPGYGAYSATKAAQNHVCRAMHLELATHDIPVSSVHPISTRTEFGDVAAERSGKAPNHGRDPDHAPRGFVQTPERVADAVVRCLRKPTPEVWTSTMTRFAASLFTFAPRLQDFALRRAAGRT